jgi:hypothetical protein
MDNINGSHEECSRTSCTKIAGEKTSKESVARERGVKKHIDPKKNIGWAGLGWDGMVIFFEAPCHADLTSSR